MTLDKIEALMDEIQIVCGCAANERAIDPEYYRETLRGARIRAMQAKKEIAKLRASVDVEKVREALDIEVEHYTLPDTAAFKEKYKQMPRTAKDEAATTLLELVGEK